MRLIIHLFGPAARAVGDRQIALDVVKLPITCGDLRNTLRETEPRLAKTLKTARFAVNDDFASDETSIDGSAEIALIDGVSGG